MTASTVFTMWLTLDRWSCRWPSKSPDIVSHGANNFVKVRERTAAEGELAGEYVLLSGDTQLISQHDWAKLGVKQVDGSNDPDGFWTRRAARGRKAASFSVASTSNRDR